MDVSDLLAITLRDKLKIKVAKWGKPKKIFRKKKKKMSYIKHKKGKCNDAECNK